MIFNDIKLRNAASKIKIVIFDVDGVMTDGSLTFDENGVEYKTFNCKDGQGIVMLNNSGFITAIITARLNGTVEHRFKTLKMAKLFQGQKNKAEALEELVKEFNVDYSQIAYMGDDLPDICVLEKVGLACCPKDAVDEVLNLADFVSTKNGGQGAVRELCDFLLASSKNKEQLCKLYVKTRK